MIFVSVLENKYKCEQIKRVFNCYQCRQVTVNSADNVDIEEALMTNEKTAVTDIMNGKYCIYVM